MAHLDQIDNYAKERFVFHFAYFNSYLIYLNAVKFSQLI